MLSGGMGRGQGEPGTRNIMRTKRKRILCTTNTLNLLQEHEILNFISVLAGTTLMTIKYSVANYQAEGLALVWFVFVLALEFIGHGQPLKGKGVAYIPDLQTASDGFIFQDSKVVI